MFLFRAHVEARPKFPQLVIVTLSACQDDSLQLRFCNTSGLLYCPLQSGNRSACRKSAMPDKSSPLNPWTPKACRFDLIRNQANLALSGLRLEQLREDRDS